MLAACSSIGHNSVMDVSVVIPALNEAENLPGFLEILKANLQSLGISFEVIVVDGGSSDDTTRIAEDHGARVFVEAGTGFAAAIRRGVTESRGRYIITMDGDGSHDPSYVAQLVEAAETSDVVIASRYVPGGGALCPISRDLLSRILNWWLRNMLSLSIRDISGGFRLYRRTVFDEFEIRGRNFEVQAEIVVRAYARGFRIVEVPFEYHPRQHGRTKARVWSYGWAFLRTGLSLWRLRNTVYFADYDHRAFESRIPLQRLWHWRRYRLIAKFLEGGHPVLDAGCGSGRFVLTGRPFGVDTDLAKARYVTGRGGRVVCADAVSLPFKNGVFKQVVCSEVVEHIRGGQDIFQELARVLEPGGVLVITTPDYGSPVWRVIERLYERLLPGAYAVHHVTRYDRKRLVEGLIRSGFDVERIERMFRSVLVAKAYKGNG